MEELTVTDPTVDRRFGRPLDHVAAKTRAPGFTLIELLVTLGCVALLIGLLVPAVQSGREAARKTQCRSNLKQIGLALSSYESEYGMWPACLSRVGSWHVAILPQVGRAELFKKLDFSDPDEPAWPIRGTEMPLYLCPSDEASSKNLSSYGKLVTATSYLGNTGTGYLDFGFNGVFRHFTPVTSLWPEGPVRVADVRDGLSQTASVAEVLHAYGNIYETSRLRNVFNSPVSTAMGGAWSDVVESCLSIPENPQSIGMHGNPAAHGFDWVHGNIGWSTYNHVLPPQQPSCFNGSDVMSGMYTSQSRHSGSVQVLFADGHVNNMSENVDLTVWRAFGSKD